jgi:hypothetical protein
MVNWTEKRLERIQQLHKVGFSATIIARKLGPSFTKGIVLRKINQLQAERLERARVRAARKEAKAEKLSPPRPQPAPKAIIATARPTRPAPRITAVTQPAPKPPTIRGIALFDLREGHCRWPVAGERIARLFCGSATVGTSSWCDQHQRIAFSGPGRPTKQAGATH